MLKFFILLLLFVNSISVDGKGEKGGKSDKGVVSDEVGVDEVGCCLDNFDRSSDSLDVMNYDCTQLTPFGKDRCVNVFSSVSVSDSVSDSVSVCHWGIGKEECKIPVFNKCVRMPRYESHFQQIVDVGRCRGGCKGLMKCAPDNYGIMNLGSGGDEAMNVRVIKDCKCDDCVVIEKSKIIEIPVGKCAGKCQDKQTDLTCMAGINDDFSVSNGLEVSNPSTDLLSGILSQCSAGVQSGFDVFTDNRCFGHTFSKCFQKGLCDLKGAVLNICMRAANVPLTNTDSLILGVDGSSLWSRSLPDLNGGSWNPGNTLCTFINLDNLPGSGASILGIIDAMNHLDVVVQDDTAVDFVRLGLEYEDCFKCLPVNSVVSTMYTENGLTHFENIKDCDCLRTNKCHRESYFQTFYPGTKYEATIDLGQCLGNCNNGSICRGKEVSSMKLLAPEGVRLVDVIKACSC